MKTKEKFKSSIRRGTGETYLLIQKNPETDFSDEIIQASVKNYAYDPQCEGNRAVYINGLISLSKQKEKISQSVINALPEEKENAWDLDQLFDIAAILAKQGNNKAREAIYKRYHNDTIEGAEWCGEDALIEIDGITGLKHIAEIRGKNLLQNKDDWEDSFFVDDFQENNPDINIYKELQKEAENNLNIEFYLNTILKNKFKRYERKKRTKYSYEVVKKRIDDNITVPLPPIAVKDLTAGDITKLADDFLKEKSRIRQEKYLRVFDRVKYPYDYKYILETAKGKDDENDRLVEFAVDSLKYFAGEDIRTFAVRKIQNTEHPYIYTNLLVSNYRKDDYKLLKQIVDRTENEDEIHDLVRSYIKIYEANKTHECREPLEAIYGKLTCGLHREDIVKIMIENNVLSDTINEEIKYDSLEEIRSLHEERGN